MEETKPSEKFTVPGAIVAAGVIIALAIIYTNGGKGKVAKEASNPSDIVAADKAEKAKLADGIKPISAEDHLLGNPNAPVKIIEFSDIECPFCKRFHPTMKQVMEEYGKTGKVAWIYRHFPLQTHPKATPEAYATECAAELGGNEMFWNYLDKIFEASLTNNQTDLAVLPQIAETLGLDVAKFNTCLDSGKYADLVNAHIADGLAAGVSGTPYSVVIGPDDKKYPIGGAFPYETVKDTIEIALKGSK